MKKLSNRQRVSGHKKRKADRAIKQRAGENHVKYNPPKSWQPLRANPLDMAAASLTLGAFMHRQLAGLDTALDAPPLGVITSRSRLGEADE